MRRLNTLRGRKRPDGYYHGLISVALGAVGAASFCAIAFPDIRIALSYAIGVLIQLILDPDLDQPSVTAAEWRVLKLPIIGRLIGPVWLAITTAYSMLFNWRLKNRIFKHRGISHWPVIGTLTRVLFFGLPIYLAVRLVSGGQVDIPAQ